MSTKWVCVVTSIAARVTATVACESLQLSMLHADNDWLCGNGEKNAQIEIISWRCSLWRNRLKRIRMRKEMAALEWRQRWRRELVCELRANAIHLTSTATQLHEVPRSVVVSFFKIIKKNSFSHFSVVLVVSLRSFRFVSLCDERSFVVCGANRRRAERAKDGKNRQQNALTLRVHSFLFFVYCDKPKTKHTTNSR